VARPDREWTIFVAGAALFLGLYVLGFFYWAFVFQVTRPGFCPNWTLR